MKTCTVCLLEKRLGEFARDRTHAQGRASRCLDCNSAYLAEYRLANPDKFIPRGPYLRDLDPSDPGLDYARGTLAKAIKKEDGCLLWPLKLGGTGYGNARVYGRTVRAHSIALHISPRGPVPPTYGLDRDIHVRHLCENKGCVNWKHLLVGSSSENQRDRTGVRSYAEVVGDLIITHPTSQHEATMARALDAVYGAEAWREALAALDPRP